MKKGHDGNNDPISLDQLVDNSVSAEDKNASTTVTSDKAEGSTVEPPILESFSPEPADDVDAIPLDLLAGADSLSNDNLDPNESPDSDSSSRGRNDKNSIIPEGDDELSYDGFLLR